MAAPPVESGQRPTCMEKHHILPPLWREGMRRAARMAGAGPVGNALGAWMKSLQQMVGQTTSTPMRSVEVTQLIDWLFDFAEQLLNMQRRLVKSLVASRPAAREP